MTPHQDCAVLKKEAKVLADKLADSVFTTLADSLADTWRIEIEKAKNPMFMRACGVFDLADNLADRWRGPIRQSATPFRVADVRRTMDFGHQFLWKTGSMGVR